MSKRKRVVLSINQKLEIINKSENGHTVKSLMREYEIGDQTVRDIIKKKQKLLEFAGNSDNPKGMCNRKTMKTSTYEDLDKAMVMWFNQQRAAGIPISGAVCAAKAKHFFEELEIPGDFNASSGWLTRFKQRYGIRQITVQGEKLSSDKSASENFVLDFQNFVREENLSAEQIYNADETGLYWKCLPQKTLAYETEKNAPGHKKQKQRITVLCCANASGSHFLDLGVIGTARKPRAFSKMKKDSSLPVSYYSNKTAWMTVEIFSDWFKTKFVPAVRKHLENVGLPQKAVLLLDNAPSHPNEEILKSEDGNIFVKYLPPNVTAVIQPMDQGVIQKLKTTYRRNLLLKLVEEGYDNLLSFWKNLTVLDAIYYVADAWKSIKSTTVKKSWKAILPDIEKEIPIEDDDSIDLQKKILEDLRKLDSSGNVDEEAVQQWINEDSEMECYEVLSDDDIVLRVACDSEKTRNYEECSESDEENLITPQKLSHGDALLHTEALLNYLEQEDESTPAEKMILRNLRSKIRRRVNEKQKQTSITSFFTKM